MGIISKFTAVVGAIGFAIGGLCATPAAAQATRTWVSGVGDDLNPCSRTAPCKTFAGAISKTATNGEINCLDPGAYGAVTIGKAMSIVCQYTEAGALATLGSNDITVNAPAGDNVFLSGLDLQGANTGLNGVRFIGGASLHITNCIIRNFGAANGQGVLFAPTGTSELYISDSVIANNGSGATGGGVQIAPTGAGGNAKVTLTNVRIENNANNGFRVDTTGTTNAAGVIVSAENISVAGNTNGVVLNTPAGTTVARMMLVNSNISNNSGVGIIGSGANSAIRVGNTTVTGNATGLSFGGGALGLTYGNNRVVGNTTSDGVFTAVPIGTQ